jgi:hypothetical protein
MIFYKKRDIVKNPYIPDNLDINETNKITRVQMLDDGLTFTKGQQWTVAYYTLLIQGAIFAFHTIFSGLNVDYLIHIFEAAMSLIASGLTAIIGWSLINGYSDTMDEYRQLIDGYLGTKPPGEPRAFEKYLLALFKSIFVASFVFVAFYVVISSFFIIKPI